MLEIADIGICYSKCLTGIPEYWFLNKYVKIQITVIPAWKLDIVKHLTGEKYANAG